MGIKVTRIPVAIAKRGDIDLAINLNSEELGFTSDDSITFQDLSLKGRVYAVDKEIIADLKLVGDKHFICSRCLIEIEENFSKKCLIVEKMPKEKYWNLALLVRDEILLENPMQILCESNCKGLCFKCGLNLNEAKCLC